jgi:hypothetical protein
VDAVSTPKEEENGLRDMDELTFVNARARFFPFWWQSIGLSAGSAPVYQVAYSSAEDLALARAVKPDEVNAEYHLIEHHEPK